MLPKGSTECQFGCLLSDHKQVTGAVGTGSHSSLERRDLPQGCEGRVLGQDLVCSEDGGFSPFTRTLEVRARAHKLRPSAS